ncbi:hypothetical protein [Streptomyces sp. MMBL 11-3]|uniref:hypothetical protein n=1 Tax=Streptomyces sp. MMBL 11-3 TaxID=3382639 RepID=UPI0039B602DF
MSVYVLTRRSVIIEEADGESTFLNLPLPCSKETAAEGHPVEGAPRTLPLDPGRELMVVETAVGLHRVDALRERLVDPAVPHSNAPLPRWPDTNSLALR